MASCHDITDTKKIDYILWGSLAIIFVSYTNLMTTDFLTSITAIMNEMWWGIFLGIASVAAIDLLPQKTLLKILGKQTGINSIFRAAFAGVVLDVCSHGIILIAMKLYKRGMGIGQVMAFLIASPWNSLSLTFILIALVGLKWTLLFIALSTLVAIITGILFQSLVAKKILPENPNKLDLKIEPKKKSSQPLLIRAISESQMVLRWVFFGVVLAALIRTFVPMDMFQNYFGPTLIGLGLTLIAATIIEVCSEGSVPIAADLLTRAAAPGNAFTFLMAGVATDITEIMALKETTKSWQLALALPLLTVPQFLVIGYILNQF